MGALGGGGLWWRFPSCGGGGGDRRRRRRRRPGSSSSESIGAGSEGRPLFDFPLKQATIAASLTFTGDTVAQVRDRFVRYFHGERGEENKIRADSVLGLRFARLYPNTDESVELKFLHGDLRVMEDLQLSLISFPSSSESTSAKILIHLNQKGYHIGSK